MTKLFSGAPINYGPTLPPATAPSNGALFFKTKVDSDGVSNPAGLYILSFTNDLTPTSPGDQVGFAWVPSVVLSPYLLRDGSALMTGNLRSTAGLRVAYGLPGGNDNTNFGYAFGNDGDTGMFASGLDPVAQKLSFFFNSAERLTITNADVQIAGNTIWHAGNDGPNSTLDADTLDGQHASAFLTRGTMSDPLVDPWTIPINTRTSGVLGLARGGTNMPTVNTNGIVYAASATTLDTIQAGALGQMLIVGTGGVPVWANVTAVVSSNSSTITNSGVGTMSFSWEAIAGQPTALWGSLDGVTSKIWNPSNFNVSNANTVGTYSPAVAAAGSTVVVRDASANVAAHYFDTSAPDGENSVFGQFMVSNNNDRLLRRASVAYVSSVLGLDNFVSKTSDTMSGTLNMNNNKIIGLAAITNASLASDAATKGYVDTAIPAWVAANSSTYVADYSRRSPVRTAVEGSFIITADLAGCLFYATGLQTITVYTDTMMVTRGLAVIPVGSIITIANSFSTNNLVFSNLWVTRSGVGVYAAGHTFEIDNTALITLVKVDQDKWFLSGVGIV